MESDPITVRAREFIQLLGNMYKFLEDATGVSSTRWRDLNHGKTRAIPADMLHTLCETWPEFALWFATGAKQGTRGHTAPRDYYDLHHGRIAAVESGAIKLFRDKQGVLQPDLGDQTIDDKKSPAYENSVAFRILSFSAFTSYEDAEALAPLFCKAFLQPLKKGGQSMILPRRTLKQWINQFPITEPQSNAHEQNYPKRYFLAQPPAPRKS